MSLRTQFPSASRSAPLPAHWHGCGSRPRISAKFSVKQPGTRIESTNTGGTAQPSSSLNKRKDTAMMDNKVKDALDQARAASQELHRAISDAAAKRSGA